MSASSPSLKPDLLAALAERAEAADWNLHWPAASVGLLKELDAHRWSLPVEFSGMACDGPTLQDGYRQLGQACLTTAFIFSQREAAVSRLLTSRERPIAKDLLRQLAGGDFWATVGVAQLTSSRQHLGPVLRAEPDGDHLRLNGYVPWVSGAAAADVLILGAIRGNDPILLVVPKDEPGLTIDPPMDLLALRGSQTAQVRLHDVRLEQRYLLEDRPDKVNAGDSAGGLTTSCLALALTGAALTHLQTEAKRRPDLVSISERLAQQYSELWAELLELAAAAQPQANRFPRLRASATQAALRTTQAALTASKGMGFVHPHPAQRWARQAMFFLVWSCPRPTTEAIMTLLCEL